MNSSDSIATESLLLGGIEPHALLLQCLSDDCQLYKVMTVENLLYSLAGNYLHFNRVNAYKDFPGADISDGKQLPSDQTSNASVAFASNPRVSAASYYDQCRSRTYACCFSIDNSDHIWDAYGKGSALGKVCIVFNLGKLKTRLNAVLNPSSSVLLYAGTPCKQIFSVNYGLINYVPFSSHQTNAQHLSNPIINTYLKDQSYQQEKEFRVSLSAIGMGQFALNDNSLFEFPPALQLEFDFRQAIADGTIVQILTPPTASCDILLKELGKFRIIPASENNAG